MKCCIYLSWHEIIKYLWYGRPVKFIRTTGKVLNMSHQLTINYCKKVSSTPDFRTSKQKLKVTFLLILGIN